MFFSFFGGEGVFFCSFVFFKDEIQLLDIFQDLALFVVSKPLFFFFFE